MERANAKRTPPLSMITETTTTLAGGSRGCSLDILWRYHTEIGRHGLWEETEGELPFITPELWRIEDVVVIYQSIFEHHRPNTIFLCISPAKLIEISWLANLNFGVHALAQSALFQSRDRPICSPWEVECDSDCHRGEYGCSSPSNSP